MAESDWAHLNNKLTSEEEIGQVLARIVHSLLSQQQSQEEIDSPPFDAQTPDEVFHQQCSPPGTPLSGKRSLPADLKLCEEEPVVLRHPGGHAASPRPTVGRLRSLQ